MSDFIYLYGFVPADASAPSGVTGIAGRDVELIDAGPVKAVTSAVPADVYDPAQLDQRLQDLNWVAAQGVAHEVVVAWFVDHAQILPAALFTMYSGVDALREALAERTQLLSSELARLKNKREWDVKISFNERDVAAHAGMLSQRIGELDGEIATASPGKRFLLQKQRADLLKTETRAAASRLANEAIDAVRPLAAEVKVLPLPRSADELPVILHAAALTDRDKESQLKSALEAHKQRLEQYGVTLRFSGPWAPYRFTGENERASAE